MEIKHFDDAHTFYAHIEPFLVTHEAENNLILGLTNNLRQNQHAYGESQPYMATIEHAGQIILVVLRTPPHNVILSLTDDLKSIEVAADDLKAQYGKLPGVVAISGIANPFIAYWQRITGQPYKIHMNQHIYKLDKVIPVQGVAGSMRQAAETDRELLIDWFIGFNVDGLNTRPERKDVQPGINRFLDPETVLYLAIWEVDGQPVSMAGINSVTPNGVRIGAVYTPPEHRKKGYASACVAALSQMALDKGQKFCFLYTDLGNPTSNHIYQDIGYQSICDADVYDFDE